MINSRKIITLFFILFTFFISFSPVYSTEKVGSWNNATKLPYFLANHPTINILDKLVISGGSTTFVRSDVISSKISPDGTLTIWNNFPLASLPQETFWHSSVTKNNFIYVLGGAIYPNSEVNSINYVSRGFLDASGNITGWVPMTSLPKKLASGSAVVVGNKIYFTGGGTWTGGGDPVLSNSVYMAEIDASGNLGSWQSLTPLPLPLMQHTLIETGSQLIVMGGTTSIWSQTNKVYSAEINTDGTIGSWTEITLFPLKKPNRAFMANKIGNYVILAGGVTDNGVTDEVYYSEIGADGNTGEWLLSANKLPKINCIAGSAIWNDYMYITGGHDGTGGPNNYYDTVWYSKIDIFSTPTPTPTPIPPTPTPTPPTPVVFLPGLGGSINFIEMFLGNTKPDGWRMTPGARVYDNLLEAFEGHPDFHVFYYDWRKPVTENAQKLHDFIQNTVIPPENKVDLVGHSLGGLVARTCVQKNTDHCFTDKLITVGSPNFGAVDAYPALEGGEIWQTGPIKLGYELLVHYFQQPGETRRETIQRVAPVLNDLLPNFDYLIKNGVTLHPSDLSFLNSLLPSLSDLSDLENITKTITGRGFNTVEQIILIEPNWIDKLLGNWPDGKPKPIGKLFTLEGDTSVLVKSSSFTNPQIENFTYDLDHGGIISEKVPLTKIMGILSLELKPGTYNSLTDEENFLVFLVHSPVKISSLDITPDSYATDELIIIPHPENRNYILNVQGIGDGYYSLSVGQIFGEKVYWNDYFGETYNGNSQSFIFSVNPQSPSENPLLDPGGISTTSQLTSRINEFKKEIQDLKIKPKYKKVLTDLLNRIQKETKNPEKVLLDLASLRFSIASYEKSKIIDKETAVTFRNKAAQIADYLEFLAFLKPKRTSKPEAQIAIKSAEKARNSINQEKLSKNGALVFVEAQEKLNKANQAFEKAEYYRAKILAFEAGSLFLESKLIK